MSMMGDGFRNRRRVARAPVVLPASVVTLSAYQYLDVVNLSSSGAKLRGSPVPEIGKTAMFRLEGYQLMCKVVWTKNDLCGIRFDEPIPPRVLAHYREAGSTAKLDMLAPSDDLTAVEPVPTAI